MGGEWPTLSLREANVTLIDCDHRTPPASDAGYPYVAIPQLRGGRVDLSNVRRIKREHLVEWTRKAKPSANDVILSRRCNPGETAVVPFDLEFALGQNLVLLRADGTKVYPPFLRWRVRGPEWWDQIGKFLNVGAVFDSLRCADVPNFELRIPPLREQRAIAHILGTLDDKIELNRRMNETLEAMARSQCGDSFLLETERKITERGLEKSATQLIPALCSAVVARGATTGVSGHRKARILDQWSSPFSKTTSSSAPKARLVAFLGSRKEIVTDHG